MDSQNVESIPREGNSKYVFKIIILVLVIYLVFVIVNIAKNIGNSGIYHDVKTTFDTLTAAVAYSYKHWYLVLPMAMVSFVALGAIQKYVAVKIDQVAKASNDPKVQETVGKAVLSEAKANEASKYQAAQEAEKAAQAQEASTKLGEEAAENFKELDDDGKAEANKVAGDVGVKIPEVPVRPGFVRIRKVHNDQLIYNDIPI